MDNNPGKIVYSSTADFLKYLSDREKSKEANKIKHKPANNKKQSSYRSFKSAE